MNPKIIALYLPQFHKVPENEAWWGKDFTDWVSAQNGEPLFEGHYQPHVPLNHYFYDLMDKSTMAWQAELMGEYGIDGLCFYHYWFGDGKKMLEKPAQNLHQWTDINISFCFCWANASWVRSWAKIQGVDYWLNEDESEDDSQSAFLMEQKYGDEREWRKHFEYLMPFFLDERYIRVDDKPVFWIYHSDFVPSLEKMTECWNHLAVENGLKGIYFIGSFYIPSCHDGLDAAVIYEPGEIMPRAPFKRDPETGLSIYDYDEYWGESIKRDFGSIKTYYTGLVNYDDTPRQGKNGHVISGSPKKFEKWLKVLLKKSEAKNNELVFLNAWNEWGEGNHLEPDEKNGYQYLDAVKRARRDYSEVEFSEDILCEYSDEQLEEIFSYKGRLSKTQTNLDVLSAWVMIKQRGISLSDHPKLKGKKHIGIYGYGVLGPLLVSEFRNTGVCIDFIADKASSNKDYKAGIVSTDIDLPEVEIVINSLANYRDDVIEHFKKKGIKNFVSIDELVFELKKKYV